MTNEKYDDGCRINLKVVGLGHTYLEGCFYCASVGAPVSKPSVESTAKEMLNKNRKVFEDLAAYDRGDKEILPIDLSHPPSSIGEWETEIHALMNIAPSKYEVQRMVDYVRSLIQMAEERGRKDMYIEICELLKKEGTNSARQRKILQNCIEEVRASKGMW